MGQSGAKWVISIYMHIFTLIVLYKKIDEGSVIIEGASRFKI